MSGTVSDDNGAGGSSDAISISQRCPSGDSVVEWRSCEQVENGTPSTSPPYWDTDDDDEFGSKPSDLYGKFTWKIETFSQINKRELRSNAFEVGGYKWEKAHRPFRCLDCQYRRELVRVYLINVEGICRRFVEERRCKVGKFIEDKTKWSSFHAFWLAMDQNTRHHMSREKSDTILKLVVKHFFIEKEVTSTLVMDSLYSGLKALECQISIQKTKTKLAEQEEMPPPIVLVEKDMFVLADDVLE